MSSNGKNNAPDSHTSFCEAEWKAIENYRQQLAEKAGRPVSLKKTLESWGPECSQRWREEYMKMAFQTQLQEILRHKWIESEKAGHDLGKAAVEDWIKKYARLWRKWWEDQQ